MKRDHTFNKCYFGKSWSVQGKLCMNF